MNQTQLTKKENSQWIADNLLMNYCLWDDNALMIESFIKNMNIPIAFDPEHFHFCITGIDKKFNEATNPKELNDGINRADFYYDKIQSILKENHYSGTAFLIKPDNSKKTAIIFSPTDKAKTSPEVLAELFKQKLSFHKNEYKRYAVTSLVKDYHGYEELHSAYLEAQRLNNMYFFSTFDEVITQELLDEIALDCGLSAIDENARKLKNMLCTSSIQEINQQIDFLFLDLIANSYNYSYFSTAFSLCELMIDLFIKVYEFDLTANSLKKIHKYNTLDDYVIDLKAMIAEIAEQLHGRTLYNSRILTAISFIKDNYRKDISLKVIADYLSVSPTALSTDFNKEVGCSISDFINQCRVKAAADSLLHSQETIAQIAQKVGFTNAKYFSQIFKDVMQISPLQYRKQAIH